jgi:Domain of unknown function (DUF3471)
MRVLDLGSGKATSSIFLAKEFGRTPGRMLANYVFDRACGKEPIPWLDRYRELRRKSLAQIDVDRQARKATRRLDTRPRHDLADYAGDYDHPSDGRITITHVEGKLIWAYRGMSEPLAHRHYDNFELPEAPAGSLRTALHPNGYPGDGAGDGRRPWDSAAREG